MNADLSPYTAVLVTSYGGPNEPDDVLPFMRNATAGRGIPDERLLEVSEHYMMFGGRSPINELNARLLDHVRAELDRRGLDVPVVIGNRNWLPYNAETVGQLAADGHRRVVGMATSAYGSYSGCRQYREDMQAAEASTDGVVSIDKITPYSDRDGFVNANARSLVAAVRDLRGRIGDDALRVLFVTHSIPISMNATSGIVRGTYETQHLRVATRVAAIASAELGETLEWELTYCSRSGPPHVPWLEPDINDRMAEVKEEGIAGVVAAPIGFLNDHMEVLYDLDTEARATARELELPFQRAATVNDDPEFHALLVDLLLERAAAARGELDDVTCAAQTCPVDCCKAPPRHTRPPASTPTAEGATV
ncbi:ferrochelatase [Tessaracoccus antarcticus]|uniref:Coproporphyrin III ferrochelatase n=1 Tax=Tessaracoccus antarcticus TaxID=2479848 RepID=A0A3M0G4Q0_9ACTN|nr:ferrochelatase [Tessaracoccus antarcticus]RMB59835.1 ferrochelatase [Tessaracoccus antarcticus]